MNKSEIFIDDSIIEISNIRTIEELERIKKIILNISRRNKYSKKSKSSKGVSNNISNKSNKFKILNKHPNINGVNISTIDLKYIPEEIKKILKDTKNIFDFTLIELGENIIPNHGHGNNEGEIYFSGNHGIKIEIEEKGSYNLDKNIIIDSKPGEKHSANNLGLSSFFGLKYSK